MFDINLRFHPSPVNETPAFLKNPTMGTVLEKHSHVTYCLCELQRYCLQSSAVQELKRQIETKKR